MRLTWGIGITCFKKKKGQLLSERVKQASPPPGSLQGIVTEAAKHIVEQYLPERVINQLVISKLTIHMGDVDMSDNKRVISGNTFSGTIGDNVNFQGDHVSQTKTVTEGVHADAFQALIKEINKLSDPDEKQDALDNTAKLQDAVASNNLDRAKKLFGWIPEAIRTTSAGMTIAKLLGLF